MRAIAFVLLVFNGIALMMLGVALYLNDWVGVVVLILSASVFSATRDLVMKRATGSEAK